MILSGAQFFVIVGIVVIFWQAMNFLWNRKKLPGSLLSALTSPFFMLNWIMNCFLSFLFPLGIFMLLYNPNKLYSINNFQVISPILISPWLCAILSSMFIPFAFPEAVSKGYFRTISDTHSVQKYIPFKDNKAIVRHFVLGTIVACLGIPIAVLLIHLSGEIGGMTMAFYTASYISVLTFISYPFAFIGFASEKSVQKIIEAMDQESPFLKRMIHRLWTCPKC